MKNLIKKSVVASALLLAFTASSQAEQFRFVVTESFIKDDYKVVYSEGETAEEAKDKLVDELKYISIEEDTLLSLPKKIISSQSVPENEELNRFDDPFFNNQAYWKSYDKDNLGVSNIDATYDIEKPLTIPVIGFVNGGFIKHNDIDYDDGFSFVNNPGTAIVPNDKYLTEVEDYSSCENGPGTGIVGIVSALQNNGIGSAGILNAKVVAANAVTCDNGHLSAVAESIAWLSGNQYTSAPAIEERAEIIHIGLSAKVECPVYLQASIDYAKLFNIPIVVSAGDQGDDVNNYAPANCKDVIVVSSIDESGNKTTFTNSGDLVSLSAPGVDIATLGQSDIEPQIISGNAAASAIVTGTIGLGKVQDPGLRNIEANYLIKTTANKHTDEICEDGSCGTGSVNSEKFVEGVTLMKSNNLSFIKPALDTTEFCDKSLYSYGKASLSLCSLSEVSFNILSEEDDFFYKLYKRKLTEEELAFLAETGLIPRLNINDEGSRLILSTKESIALVHNDDVYNQYLYGFQVCESETECSSENLFRLRNTSMEFSDACNEIFEENRPEETPEG